MIDSPSSLIRRGSKLTTAKWEQLIRPTLWFHGVVLPVGTEYKAFETRDHGYVVLRQEVAGRRIAQL